MMTAAAVSNKIEFLNAGRNLLRSVIRQRQWLLVHDKGYIESDFAIREIRNIEYALSSIKSADKMRTYLERKKTVIRYLTPATNRKSIDKLNQLLNQY
jgi:hypothetical protein